MDGMLCSSWQARQIQLSWQRLRIAEAEGRIAKLDVESADGRSRRDSSVASQGAELGVDVAELTMRLKTLYEECESLKQQRNEWEAQRRQLEMHAASQEEEVESERSSLEAQRVEIEQERGQLRSERKNLATLLQQLKEEMAQLRRGLGLCEAGQQAPASPAAVEQIAETAPPVTARRVKSGAAPVPVERSSQHSADDISETVTDSLLQFAMRTKPRPMWLAAVGVLLGAVIVASCASIFVWYRYNL